MTDPAIFSIGQGKRSVEKLIAELLNREIRFLCDVRTVPISNHAPEFCKHELREALRHAGIAYASFGQALGGRPTDPALYTDGYVDYELLMKDASFRDGTQRLVDGASAGHRLAVFCSEGAPERCHRSKAIGKLLSKFGIAMIHIDTDGASVTQQEVLARLETQPDLGLSLQSPKSSTRSRKRYA